MILSCANVEVNFGKLELPGEGGKLTPWVGRFILKKI